MSAAPRIHCRQLRRSAYSQLHRSAVVRSALTGGAHTRAAERSAMVAVLGGPAPRRGVVLQLANQVALVDGGAAQQFDLPLPAAAHLALAVGAVLQSVQARRTRKRACGRSCRPLSG